MVPQFSLATWNFIPYSQPVIDFYHFFLQNNFVSDLPFFFHFHAPQPQQGLISLLYCTSGDSETFLVTENMSYRIVEIKTIQII